MLLRNLFAALALCSVMFIGCGPKEGGEATPVDDAAAPTAPVDEGAAPDAGAEEATPPADEGDEG